MTTMAIYTLSLHDALPIFPDGPDENGAIEYARTEVSLRLSIGDRQGASAAVGWADIGAAVARTTAFDRTVRSEEHTSELQSLRHLVCRLLLEKKKNARNGI